MQSITSAGSLLFFCLDDFAHNKPLLRLNGSRASMRLSPEQVGVRRLLHRTRLVSNQLPLTAEVVCILGAAVEVALADTSSFKDEPVYATDRSRVIRIAWKCCWERLISCSKEAAIDTARRMVFDRRLRDASLNGERTGDGRQENCALQCAA